MSRDFLFFQIDSGESCARVFALIALNFSEQTYDIFVSYCWAQKPIVENLFKILTAKGFRCWMDKNELLGGELLYEELTNAITQR